MHHFTSAENIKNIKMSQNIMKMIVVFPFLILVNTLTRKLKPMVLGVFYLVEIPYRKCLCDIEISQMISFSNQLTSFYMIQVFAEWRFRTSIFTVWSWSKQIQLLVRTLTSFQFSSFFKKSFDTLSYCLKPSIIKTTFLTHWFKFSIKYFNIS